MCAKILEHAGKLNMDEYNFFLRGGVVSELMNYNKNEVKRNSSLKKSSKQSQRFAETCFMISDQKNMNQQHI